MRQFLKFLQFYKVINIFTYSYYLQISSEEESIATDRGYTSDSELTRTPKHTSRPQSPLITMPPTYNSTGGWIFVGREGDIQPMLSHSSPAINQYSIVHERQLLVHDPQGLVKCCESLAFLVRDVAHITPYNFENCVHCIRTFVEASLHGNGRRRRTSSSRNRKKVPARRRGKMNHRSPPGSGPDDDEDSDYDELPSGYHQISIQVKFLDLTRLFSLSLLLKLFLPETFHVLQILSISKN